MTWVLGGRDDATLRRLLDEIGVSGRTFLIDNGMDYRRVISKAQSFTGEDLTFPIDWNNSNIGHCLARFCRRTRVVTRC